MDAPKNTGQSDAHAYTHTGSCLHVRHESTRHRQSMCASKPEQSFQLCLCKHDVITCCQSTKPKAYSLTQATITCHATDHRLKCRNRTAATRICLPPRCRADEYSGVDTLIDGHLATVIHEVDVTVLAVVDCEALSCNGPEVANTTGRIRLDKS